MIKTLSQMKKLLILLALAIIMMTNCSIAENQNTGNMVVPYTLNDRDGIIEIKTTLIQMQKRMDDQRADENRRFEEQRTDTKQQFDSLKTFIEWIIGIFTSLTIAIFYFAWWDRRTMIRPVELRLDTVELELIKKDTAFEKLMNGLRQLAKNNPQVYEFLKNNHLL
jgi:uncharacterized protein YdhG (YjbR/CyaY superfamily)